VTQAQSQKLTFEEYLNYRDDTDNRYELIDGALVPLPPESGFNDFIARYLFALFFVRGIVPLQLMSLGKCELQVPVLRSNDAQNRYPDFVVLREEHWQLTQTRLTITIDMPPPRFVVEIVSPGKENEERDYISKRAQYAARGIPEYWIVNPARSNVMVLQLDGKEYREVGTFSGTEQIISPTFPNLELRAEQVFAGNL